MQPAENRNPGKQRSLRSPISSISNVSSTVQRGKLRHRHPLLGILSLEVLGLESRTFYPHSPLQTRAEPLPRPPADPGLAKPTAPADPGGATPTGTFAGF